MTMRIKLDPVATGTFPSTQGRTVIATTVGARGEFLRLCIATEDVTRVLGRIQTAAGASFPLTTVEKPYDAQLTVVHGKRVQMIQLRNLSAMFPMVQVLRDGFVLVVAPRCAMRDSQWSRPGIECAHL